MNDPVIRARDLWKIYDQNGPEGYAALRGADLEIARGRVGEFCPEFRRRNKLVRP